RLIGSQKAIVGVQYGVTRDRHYGESVWNGLHFSVIDTGGYLPDETDVLVAGVREQVHIAIEESDVILFVVDTKGGITSLDDSVARLLREQDKPVLLVPNKADNDERTFNAAEFYALGFKELYPISAINGRGTGDLLDEVVKNLPEESNEQEPEIGRASYRKREIISM